MLPSDREMVLIKGFSTKVIALMVVALSYLLLFQTSSVEAVDFIGYVKGECTGVGITCKGIGENVCCQYGSKLNSIENKGLSNDQVASAFIGGYCQTWVATTTRSGCWSNWGDLTGGRWNRRTKTSPSKGSELPGENSTPCKSTMLPNAVVYSVSGSSNGTWVLETGSDNLGDVVEQLDNVPVDQKVAWLQNAGAHFDADLVDVIQMITKK